MQKHLLETRVTWWKGKEETLMFLGVTVRSGYQSQRGGGSLSKPSFIGGY